MMESLDKDTSPQRKERSYWGDEVVTDYYLEHMKSLDSRELDRQLGKDMRILANAVERLNRGEKAIADVFAALVEFYVERKVQNEIQDCLAQVLKIR